MSLVCMDIFQRLNEKHFENNRPSDVERGDERRVFGYRILNFALMMATFSLMKRPMIALYTWWKHIFS